MCAYHDYYTNIYTSLEAETQRIHLVKIVKVLGEGGFSFVYLAQDEVSGVSASSYDCARVMATDTNHVGSERVRPEENSVPNWRRGC
jgi:serine/threonine protein kinase